MSIRDRRPNLRPDSPGMDNFITFAPLVVAIISVPLGIHTGDPAFTIIMGVGGLALFLYFFLTGPIVAAWRAKLRHRRLMRDPQYRARVEKIAQAREDLDSGNPAKRAAAQKILDQTERQEQKARDKREHGGVEAKSR